MCVLWICVLSTVPAIAGDISNSGYSGSAICRECHPGFHDLWSTSRHGATVRTIAETLPDLDAAERTGMVRFSRGTYHLTLGDGSATFVERTRARQLLSQDQGDPALRAPCTALPSAETSADRRYRVEYVLGGKQLRYFLAPIEDGRLQVLPIAYDIRRREWFDPTAGDSAPAHEGGGLRPATRADPKGAGTEARSTEPSLDWRADAYTFNLSCSECHVSQVSARYDPAAAGFRSSWLEPGINCESCHGPAAGHVEVCRAAVDRPPLKDLRIIGTRDFTAGQINSLCAPCHALAEPLTPAYQPGAPFFDHYDLAGLENRAFAPDGGALGETYTFTSWMDNPCARAGRLHCLHCHTSGGRDRFAGDQANAACLPCHARQVERAAQHSRHKPDGAGSRCVRCHMPATEYARMVRHDHSFRPPAPAVSVAFALPNACGACHADHDAAWADAWVRRWHGNRRSKAVLDKAGLLAEAREGDWRRLTAMLKALRTERERPLFVSSMITLLSGCDDERKWPSLRDALSSASPWVRARAAAAFEGQLTAEALVALLSAARDPVRLVRVQAGRALAGAPEGLFSSGTQRAVDNAMAEFETAMHSRWGVASAQAELGHYYLARGRPRQAAAAFEQASRLDSGEIGYLVSAATAWHRSGEMARAEERLRSALRLAPAASEVYRNLGDLLALQGRCQEETALYRQALTKVAPTSRGEFVQRLARQQGSMRSPGPAE